LGLEHIAALSNLNTLSLAFTRVTDRGLVHLKRLTKLSSLDLSDTQVTDTGVKELMRALPNLTIDR
jgi:internalin A